MTNDGDTYVAKQVPDQHRKELLDSLDFAKGQLIAADVLSIQSSMPRDEFERLFAALA